MRGSARQQLDDALLARGSQLAAGGVPALGVR